MKETDCCIAFEGGSIAASVNYFPDSVSRVTLQEYSYLRKIALNDENRTLLSLRTDSDGERLIVGRYVGLIPLPSGKILEILPKCFSGTDASLRARRALLRMTARSGSLPLKALDRVAQTNADRPFHHSLLNQFLDEMERLLGFGLSSAYSPHEEARPVLRGKLMAMKQIRSREPIPLRFWTCAQEYSEIRPENRLMRSALDRIAPLARHYSQIRFSRILEYFETVPASCDITGDFRAWSHDRLSSRYAPVEPWCRLILENSGSPYSGTHSLPALLFPMERLFESYVGACIRESLFSGFSLVSQSTRWSLTIRKDRYFSKLKPDFIIRQGDSDICVIDAKWKLIGKNSNSGDPEDVTSADLLQLYAYGRHYLGGKGSMALVYPKTELFNECSETLTYVADRDLSLKLIPVDLDKIPEELGHFIRGVLDSVEPDMVMIQ